MIVKVCGITNAEDAAAAIGGGANAIGFNFYPQSPRYIAPERAAEIITASGVRRVGVFVNETRARVEEIARIAALDVAQLHGEEPVGEYPQSVTVWKAARVTAGFDLATFVDFPAEALLLDGPAGELYGGSGTGFHWELAAQGGKTTTDFETLAPLGASRLNGGGSEDWLPPLALRRIILAGGLDASNVAEAIAIAHPWGVDACSRLETAPGKKDHQKMLEFVRAARKAMQS